MRCAVIAVSVSLVVACGSSSDSNGAAGSDGGGATGGAAGSGGNAGASGSGGSGAASGSGGSGAASGSGGSGGASGGGGATSCEPFGHFGAPGNTFAIPKPSGDGFNFPDVQKSFPNVDWAGIDRLYIPAGHYKTFNLGNLPARDAAHPLVITNQGGQVMVGPNLGGNYIWTMGGGSNWILTGRYDADSQTGDAAFPGHRCGAYAASRGKYGFLSDDALDTTGAYLHMGLAVSDASDFEIEYVEVERSGFAGMRLLNSRAAGDAAHDMANVRIHDNYIHDTGGEGTYFGWTGAPPANLLPGLKIYNNRFVRTGNEALQIQDLGDGTEVYNNVIAFAALHWRDNGLGNYQDNNSQIQTREGTISIHDNVFMGGAGSVLSFWSQPETGDGERHVTFKDNYFADAKSLMAYVGGESTAASDFHFQNNFFTGMDFSYDLLDPAATDPGVVFKVSGNVKGPVTFDGNTWDGANKLVAGPVSGSGNTNASVTPIEFEDSGYPAGVPVQKLEIWAPKATLSPGTPDITYAVGDLVMFDGDLYQATAQNTNQRPPDHPESWKKLPAPTDDFRVKAGSPYATLGVH